MEANDVVVIGAGPAGLTAAVYLGRFRRSVRVLDGGPSRARWIPTSHNTPGFPDGIGGGQLLTRLAVQARRYGAVIAPGRVIAVTPDAQGFTLVVEDQSPLQARLVLMATGVLDQLPPIEGVEAAIRQSLVRMCPICDAYEAIDRPIAVLGDGDLGAREALFLRDYSRDVTLLHVGKAAELTETPALSRAGVEVIEVELAAIRLEAAQVAAAGRRFDHLYLALGCRLQSALATQCGAAHDDQNNIVVDAHQETTIAGLFAAGDVVRGLNQIAVAAGEAAVAATAMHNRLRA